MKNTQQITLFNAVTPVAITSSTDATPIVVTATAHGLANDDRVLIIGHTTNVAANGIFRVANKTANTFELVDEFTRANIAGSGAGAGASGILMPAPPVVYTGDWHNVILSVVTAGTATTTMKIAGSLGKPSVQATTSPRYDFPNFAATVSASNPYTFIGYYDQDSGNFVDGSTGIVATATDLNQMLKVNSAGQKYLTLIPTSWTQGAITAKLILTDNE